MTARCGLACMVMFAGVLLAGCGVDCSTYTFDHASWTGPKALEQSNDSLSPRQRLVGGLVDCKILVGNTQAEVRRLLGEPNSRNRNNTPDSATTWTYEVGTVGGGFDNETLSVNFDERRHVIELTRSFG